MTAAHLDFVRLLPCAACGIDNSLEHRAAHHLIGGRYSQSRADDSRAVPLCQPCHQGPDGLHGDGDEVRWAATLKLNLQWLAGALWGVSGDYERAVAAIAMARRV